ncbi:MAG: 50S ribosomal protein L7/L12 [Nitrospirota bacterium]
MAKVTKEQVFEFIDNMTILQMSEFIKEFEERYGVTASVPVTAVTAAPSAATVAPQEEKTTFDVVLTSSGEKKIQVIKVIRELTGLGLKEAKELVDGVPKTIKSGVSKEDAETIKSKLTEVGATIEIK